MPLMSNMVTMEQSQIQQILQMLANRPRLRYRLRPHCQFRWLPSKLCQTWINTGKALKIQLPYFFDSVNSNIRNIHATSTDIFGIRPAPHEWVFHSSRCVASRRVRIWFLFSPMFYFGRWKIDLLVAWFSLSVIVRCKICHKNTTLAKSRLNVWKRNAQHEKRIRVGQPLRLDRCFTINY